MTRTARPFRRDDGRPPWSVLAHSLISPNVRHQRWEPAAADGGIATGLNGWLPSAEWRGWVSFDVIPSPGNKGRGPLFIVLGIHSQPKTGSDGKSVSLTKSGIVLFEEGDQRSEEHTSE